MSLTEDAPVTDATSAHACLLSPARLSQTMRHAQFMPERGAPADLFVGGAFAEPGADTGLSYTLPAQTPAVRFPTRIDVDRDFPHAVAAVAIPGAGIARAHEHMVVAGVLTFETALTSDRTPAHGTTVTIWVNGVTGVLNNGSFPIQCGQFVLVAYTRKSALPIVYGVPPIAPSQLYRELTVGAEDDVGSRRARWPSLGDEARRIYLVERMEIAEQLRMFDAAYQRLLLGKALSTAAPGGYVTVALAPGGV